MPRTTTSLVASKVVGAEIRRARLEQGLTLREVAEGLGTSASYVANLEAGRGNPTIGQLAAVADALHVEMELQFKDVGMDRLPSIPLPRLD